jgi:AcrR family transcriptional regulator
LGLDHGQENHREHPGHWTTAGDGTMPGAKASGIDSGRFSLRSWSDGPNNKEADEFCNKKLRFERAVTEAPAARRRLPGRPSPARRPSARALKTTAIFRATIEELARLDYGGLTFERIAARAGVNKTTLYRRWPKKAELVRASLIALTRSASPGPSTGSLRGDLLKISRQFVKFAASMDGQSLLRLRLIKHPEPELAAMAKALHARQQGEREGLVAAAIDRGELRPDADPRMLVDMLGGALQIRLFFRNERVDDLSIARMVDALLDGVKARPPAVRPRRLS